MMFRLLAMLWCALSANVTFSQTNSNSAFAITSKTIGAHEWTEVKQIDLTTGEVIRNVFENSNLYEVFDARSMRRITVSTKKDSVRENVYHPFAGLSAACAYDAKSNRLFYAPMFINQLRYIDLNKSTTSVYLFNNESLSTARDTEEESKQVTRMVIAADGNGYAMSNDANHLVKFTTTGEPVITDLGSVRDAPENGEISIQDPNTSLGGDMVGDASGNLVVITAKNHVFRIDIQTLTATYITKIEGLPESFTTNGAVVNAEGNLVVSSANFLTSYFTVDPKTWKATSVEPRQQVYNTSDLANQNLLYQTTFNTPNVVAINNNITIFPNPVRTKSFRVNFVNQAAGKYEIQLVDVRGRTVNDGAVAVTSNAQFTEVRVNPTLTSGVYFVKILSPSHRSVYTKKIIIE
jgi:hypothetical protein